MAELLADADSGRPLPHFPLRRCIAVTQTFVHSNAESPNVAGVLEGDEPNLRKEYVILSAHLDHLGIGAPVHGDRIYNGALDNVAGIASLIEIARHLHDSGVRLRRSVLFLAVTAEEKGELGSQYFAAHPTVPSGGIVADINMDMFMPLFPLRYLEVQGLGESTLGASIREAAKDEGVKVQADKQPRRNRFIRSDQYSFVKHGHSRARLQVRLRSGNAGGKDISGMAAHALSRAVRRCVSAGGSRGGRAVRPRHRAPFNQRGERSGKASVASHQLLPEVCALNYGALQTSNARV